MSININLSPTRKEAILFASLLEIFSNTLAVAKEDKGSEIEQYGWKVWYTGKKTYRANRDSMTIVGTKNTVLLLLANEQYETMCFEEELGK